ncbi:cytochrome c1 [Paenirhodobacter populi]|uniref:Cytochrome c1 n=1 Tax=Paenirhodobacter populi TaxID=2306993 RepID=A0A443J1U6_9RHOB|nr:cytochrome c1 [Sinirhodobacter populi]RWR14363.1 cytochrome c1 [Sinirhodobacter populi]
MIRAALIAILCAGPALAQPVPDIAYSFEGPFGTYDTAQLRRGLQVYSEVCSACHGLKYVPLRSLTEPGGPRLTADRLRDLMDLLDPVPTADGAGRPHQATDPFPAREGEGMGPDLSLMAKARAGFHGPFGTGLTQLWRGQGGPEYIAAYLAAFTEDTKEEAGAVHYRNPVFPGGWTAMPQVLFEDMVAYEDGTPATLPQMAEDVSAFLMWTAEPKLEARKRAGFVAVGLLGLLTVLLFALHRRLWTRLRQN